MCPATPHTVPTGRVCWLGQGEKMQMQVPAAAGSFPSRKHPGKCFPTGHKALRAARGILPSELCTDPSRSCPRTPWSVSVQTRVLMLTASPCPAAQPPRSSRPRFLPEPPAVVVCSLQLPEPDGKQQSRAQRPRTPQRGGNGSAPSQREAVTGSSSRDVPAAAEAPEPLLPLAAVGQSCPRAAICAQNEPVLH